MVRYGRIRPVIFKKCQYVETEGGIFSNGSRGQIIIQRRSCKEKLAARHWLKNKGTPLMSLRCSNEKLKPFLKHR